ncbi:unnamed protein product [Linum tenue]|uniref:Uncharacterized protein n=1 Tax=Linum tenue TaxID=586396 RepID=A0AAV0NJI5_9ROSI|nr:unnamed protein product [Linum tenue]
MDEKEELVAGFQLEGDATSSTPMQGFFDVATSMEDEATTVLRLGLVARKESFWFRWV